MNWRKILAPFAGLWWVITQTRNLLYNSGILPSKKFKKPIIVVGNLSIGGTGKSPHSIYLLNLLHKKFKVAVLSRGYGRKSKGFIIANYDSDAQLIGDEPMQFFNRFKNRIIVSVGENRVLALKNLFSKFSLDAVIMDDAYQHRRLKSDFNILLTNYNKLYSRDYLLPMGSLRESRINASRANIIIVTKCPHHVSDEKKLEIKNHLKIKPYQDLFFSKINYSSLIYHRDFNITLKDVSYYNIVLITGIAFETPLVNMCKNHFNSVKHLKYTDHYNFKNKDIEEINSEFSKINDPKLILTTEKDYMRLKQEYALIENLYYIPISVEIDDANKFNQIILNYVEKNK